MENGVSKYYLNVAVIGSRNYNNSIRLKDWMFELRNKMGKRLIVMSGGDSLGAEYFAKQHALEFDVKYLEYNSPCSQQNAYSAMYAGFYGQSYKVWHYARQYTELIKAADVVAIFMSEGETSKHIEFIKKKCKKLGKTVFTYY